MINLNGKVYPSGTPVFSADNRAFRYGDGLFESIRSFSGSLPFLDLHTKRLHRGMAALGMGVPAHYSSVFFQNEFSKTIEGGQLHNHRVRLTVYRESGGLYTPASNAPLFFVESQQLLTGKFEWQEKGRLAGIFDEMRLSFSPVSFFKSCNSIPFVLANIFRENNNWEEIFMLNQSGNVVCGGSSNVFLIKNRTLFTPPESEGCVLGTMRETTLHLASEMGLQVEEKPLSRSEVQHADELFLTNAAQGIQWVREVAAVKSGLKCQVARQLSLMLNGLVNSRV